MALFPTRERLVEFEVFELGPLVDQVSEKMKVDRWTAGESGRASESFLGCFRGFWCPVIDLSRFESEAL